MDFLMTYGSSESEEEVTPAPPCQLKMRPVTSPTFPSVPVAGMFFYIFFLLFSLPFKWNRG